MAYAVLFAFLVVRGGFLNFGVMSSISLVWIEGIFNLEVLVSSPSSKVEFLPKETSVVFFYVLVSSGSALHEARLVV